MKSIPFFLIILALGITLPAKAETGKVMNYYVRTPEAPKAPEGKDYVPQKGGTLNMIENRAQKEESTEETPDTQKESAEAAWERYKALAAGQAPEEEPAKIETPEPPQVAAPAPPQVATAGIPGLLQQYQNAKAKRSQMNTIVVNPGSGE